MVDGPGLAIQEAGEDRVDAYWGEQVIDDDYHANRPRRSVGTRGRQILPIWDTVSIGEAV
jgi:hypothetical protein